MPVIPACILALRPALDCHNSPDRPALRLRVAIHHGYVEWGANGWSDDKVIKAGRMCDAAETRAALIDNPESAFAVVVSRRIHHDIVVRRRLLDPAAFWAVTLSTKDGQLPGWMYVPGPTRSPSRTTGPAPAAGTVLAIDGSPEQLGFSAPVTGTGSIPAGSQLWIMVRVGGGTRLWLSATSRAMSTSDNHWLSPCMYFGTTAVVPVRTERSRSTPCSYPTMTLTG